MIGTLDSGLRSCQGIYEFDRGSLCMLRLGTSAAAREVALRGGTRIARGETVGVVHLCNEHLLPFPPAGPTLPWAAAMRRCIDRSFRSLADHVAAEPRLRNVRAFRADFGVPRRARLGPLPLLARRYGFEVITPELSLAGRCHAFGEELLQWGLARAFNPGALERHGWLRVRQELWMSRDTLLRRHASARSERLAPRC
jgi:hypothetical protein